MKDLDRVVAMRGRRCNLCVWTGDQFADDGDGNTCPQCGSTPFPRATRFLAASNLVYRKRSCAAILDADALVPELERMFSLGRHVVTTGRRRRSWHTTPRTGASAASTF